MLRFWIEQSKGWLPVWLYECRLNSPDDCVGVGWFGLLLIWRAAND